MVNLKSVSIVTFLIILISGCTTFEPLPNSENSDEEICLSIKSDKLKNQCLAYIENNPEYCQKYGCYALAVKLLNKNICTTDGWDDSDGECLNLISIAEDRNLDIELRKKLELNCDDCSNVNFCNIDKTDCYGSCDVSRTLCIRSVAAINNNPDLCELPQISPQLSKDICYSVVGSYNKNIETCNRISSLSDLTRERCYFNMVADSLEMKHNYLSGS